MKTIVGYHNFLHEQMQTQEELRHHTDKKKKWLMHLQYYLALQVMLLCCCQSLGYLELITLIL